MSWEWRPVLPHRVDSQLEGMCSFLLKNSFVLYRGILILFGLIKSSVLCRVGIRAGPASIWWPVPKTNPQPWRYQLMPLLEVLTPWNCHLFPQGCLSEEDREKEESAVTVKLASVMHSARQNCNCFSALQDLFFSLCFVFFWWEFWLYIFVVLKCQPSLAKALHVFSFFFNEFYQFWGACF